MPFSSLSPELIAIIVNYLHQSNEPLSRYATVSKPFCEAIEAINFADLSISSAQFGKARDIIDIQPQRRGAALRKLTTTIILPTYTNRECAYFEERASERRLNNESFSNSIAKLFDVLRLCDAVVSSRPITLQLFDFYSPMDGAHRGEEKYRLDEEAQDLGHRHDIFEHRYEHSYLSLIGKSGSILPELNRVKTFVVTADTPRYIEPATVVALTSKLPRVEIIRWSLNDDERKYPRLRVQLRKDFAQELTTLRTPAATTFELKYMNNTPGNEGFQIASVHADSTRDPFSMGLRTYLHTCNLVHISLTGPICLGSDFFWSTAEETSLASRWTALRIFDVDLSTIRPDGGWYLSRDPGTTFDSDDGVASNDDASVPEDPDGEESGSEYDSYDSLFKITERPPESYNRFREDRIIGNEPSRHFRTYPTPELEKFFEATARAAVHMPQVERFAVGFTIMPCRRTDRSVQDLDFQFVSSGYEISPAENRDEVHRNRLYWRVPQGWQMSEELKMLWDVVIEKEGVIKYEGW